MSIFDAISAADVPSVTSLLHKSSDICKVIHSSGEPLLHYCVSVMGLGADSSPDRFRQKTIVDLVAKFCDVNAKDSWGRTALHTAAIKGQSDVAEILLSHSALVNAVDDFGNTPLMLLAEELLIEADEALATAKILLNHGADIKARNADGQDVLDLTTSIPEVEQFIKQFF